MQAIRRILAEHPMELIWPLAVFAGTFLLGWLVRRLVMRALHAWTARTGSRPALHFAIQISDLPAKLTSWSSTALLILWILSLTIMCMRVAGNLVRYYGSDVPGAMPVTTLTQNLTQLAVLIIGILFLMKELRLDITPMLTALGVGGLAVALALQDTLSNLFGGFYVAIARQVRLGDYIKLNSSGEEGYVTDIGWRSTTIRTLDNSMIIVPNAKLAQAIVTNYHLPEKRMASKVQVGVGYGSDPERIERVLLDIGRQGAQEIPGMLAEPGPSVVFDPGFGESSLGFTLNYHVAEFADQGGVRHELRKRIFHRFREEGIEIPFPTRTVQLVGPYQPKP
jgi:small-conductance mechanosensitive channel